MRIRMYPLWVLVGILLFFSVAVGVLYFSFGTRPETGRWVAECIEKKSYAVRSKSPKIVILAGSNGLYGFSAQRISEKYGIESVNAATHAGLGIGYILYYGRQYFAKGRLFILPLEYELYGGSWGDPAYFYQVIGYDPGYFHSLSLIDKYNFFRAISMDDRINLFVASMSPYPKNNSNGYQSRTLNSWGDETNNKLSDRTPAMTAPVIKNAAPLKYSINTDSWRKLEDFVRDANYAGCKVVLAYPNIYSKALDVNLNHDFFTELQQKASKSGISIIGSPQNSSYGEESLWDTFYHQTRAGQTKSTDRLMSDILKTGFCK